MIAWEYGAESKSQMNRPENRIVGRASKHAVERNDWKREAEEEGKGGDVEHWQGRAPYEGRGAARRRAVVSRRMMVL